MNEEQIRQALAGVVDPELGLDVVALGLVYRAEQTEGGIEIDLTMTTPSCPLGEHMREEAERAIAAAFPGVRARVNLVWSPPWGPERMSAAAKTALGW